MQKMSLVAYHRLLELMGNGSLQAGDFISHRQLANRLNIGKLSISQALDILEQKGLVESIPKVGTRIRPVTPEDIWGVLQWRIALECRTAFLAAQWISPEQRKKLLPLGQELDELVRNPPQQMEITYRHEKEKEFHLFVAECTHCERLVADLQNLDIYFLMLLSSDLIQAFRRNIRLVPHEQIAEAILAGDASCAAERMQRHLEESPEMAGFTEWYVQERKTHSSKAALQKKT